MEWIESKKLILKIFNKYKFVVLIIVIGIILMVLPSKSNDNSSNQKQPVPASDNVTLDDELKDILRQIKGAGRVEVILTEAKGVQYIYQTNDNTTTDGDRDDRKTDTVLITDGERNQQGLISTVISPVYLGAVVVCEGADIPAVKLAIVDAVSNATGLGADKISVLKMK